jgi:amino acid adenylation domain-containing protein
LSNDVMNGVPAELARSRCTYAEDGVEAVLRQVTLLHQAFELRAAAEPDAVVLVVGEERITCGELDAKANQLARFLVEQGVGPEVRVAICAERGAEMVVAMYAVLKAGGAYVPVDPAYPGERQANILADSGALLLLTQERLAGRVPTTSARPVFLDRDWPRVELYGTEPLPPLADERNLAYVIYTSGSTGRPKGVAIAHRSAVILSRWCARIFSPEELAGVLGSTSICFDMSIFELFVTPALGGRVILADHALSLPDLPAAGEVTLINTVPSASAELARSGGIPPSVITVNLGGEALRSALVERLYALGSVRKIYNLYGPSEDTTYSTWALMKKGDPQPPSVGRLLDGSWGYLLDRDFERVPGGEPGELYLAGEGLSRGYLGRPDMTAARFLPDPFAVCPGERMYATGDLIRYRQDGELDYLGRIDHQVKIRGFRVELGEIEATLERHPTVGDTVVVALELDGGGETADRMLVAYVVPKPGATISVPDLRESLREQLAAYMVPTHFVAMAALPLNPNGKVDRTALPKPEISGERPGFVAPRTPLETALAEIWSEVLSLPGVGVEDHFFELGGHSLLAARVIARIHDTLGRRLSARALFDAPTIERLAVLLTGLQAGEELAGIPVARDRRWIVSAGQEGMWFSERLHAGLPVFTIPLLLDLEGLLDTGALQRSLAGIVRRHETLRVVFSEVNGRPDLKLGDAVVDLPRIDLTVLPAGPRNAEADRVATALSRLSVSLDRAPLLQGYLIELDGWDHRLLIAMHHLTGDDWSTWVLAHDLAALYAADVAGRSAALPPLPLQFSDYAAWQQEWLAGAEAAEQLAFWRRRLAGAPESLDLPTDRPRPPVQGFAGGLLIAALPPRSIQALTGIALRSQATLFMAILAVLDTLLYRYSGQEDLSVGAAIANRHRSGTQGLIGLFTNTVVLRADLRGEPGFGSLLEQVRETVLEGLDRQDFPFDRLVRELRPERLLSQAALAQVFLSFQNIPPLPRQLGPGLDLRVHELGNGTSKADLTLYLRQEGETFVTAWEYASALFDPPTIARLSGHFQRLLAAAVADPARPISELSLLTIAEEEQISRWSGGVASPLEELTLQALFARQSARTPEAPAVIAERGVLSYAELEERSDLLAHHLRGLGVGPEVLVGLCLERSLEMVVALLAVLKAGGAYVPLDPEYPAERLALMLAEADIHLVLTQGRLLHVLPEPSPASIVDLDSDWLAAVHGHPAARAAIEPAVDGSGLAYAIFTSGSTGRPKGVAIPQRAIVNHMLWMQAEFPLGPGDRVLQKTPFSFDASVWELYAPLLAGATLVMAKPGGQREPAYLVDAIRQYGITIFQAVPSLLRAMLDDKRLGECGSLRRVFCGGEALAADIQRDFFAALDAELINLYGPTETTVEVTSWRCERWRADRTALLGRPITNSRLYVLDPFGEPCPAGVPGEICVGGLPVGRGYLGQPGETANRFVPDRFGGKPGARFYRTGDLGRWLPDGTLEFLGRTDHQVKVRGFRIELGEVEAMVASHPAVAESAVLVAGQRLAAYAALRPDAVPVQVAELRDFLLERLPEYMVPTSWILLKTLPHTPSGKVDRQALSGFRPEEVEELPLEEVPRNPVEERLAAIWIELLDLERVGVHQKFFEIGGHSLLAIQLISRIRRDFGIEVAVRQIFQAPTIAGLASIIEGLPSSTRSPAMLQTFSYEGGLPLSYAQSRLWFLHQLQPDSAVYNLPCLLRLRGRLDPGALDRALVEIVRRHEALRTTFLAIDGEPFQFVSVPRSSWLTRVDLTALPEGRRAAEAWRRATEAYAQPFHLATGPLMHAALLQSGPEEGLLSVTVHHIANDGWSTEILLRELFTLYGAFLAGEPSPLPDLPLQYPAFARWQRQWLSGEVVEKQLAYWRRRLEGAPWLLDLPSDRSRPAVRSSQGHLLKFALPEGLAHSLRERAKSLDATPFMLFVAAFEALLGRYTSQDCLLVGTPVANRNWAEIEGLIGFFVNTLVLRADLGGDPEFRHVVERVREATLDAQAHQDLPFEKLVEALQPERALSHTPLVQVMLVFQGAPAGLPLPSGLTVDVLEPEIRSAKVDLTFSVQEERDGGLKLDLQYSTDLFDPATMRRMAGHFETLLTGAVHRPYLRLSELPLLTAPEVDQILVEWNGEPGVPPVRCVHELFALQAERTPDAPAVRFEEEVLTYRELETRAEALARHLRRSGSGRERTVAVCFERSPAMVVAILGVLKAGSAYVPLDAESPRDRLGFVLEDCGARVLLSQDTLLEILPPFSGPVVLLTAEGLLQGEPEEEDPALGEPAGLEHLAYVIYTSGSTGSPKGVMVGHGQLASYLSGVLARMSLPAGASFATVSTLAADLGNTVIFASLVTGGCLQVISRARLSEAAALADAFERHPLDCLKIVPSHLTALLASPRAAGCLPRRLLILGGEAAPAGLIQRVLELAPGCRILNHYGPTETTVGVLTYETGRRIPVPLGRPLAGTRVLVLDRSLDLMPSGVPGELYVGGPQVTRGYLRQPDLTAGRFVPDPWGAFYGQPGSRLYATGDRGRYLADGTVEFLGRVDFQVKVRGFRVEPGEVEAALRRNPGVGEAVVIARDQCLTAYVVARPGMELTASDLRAFLKERLPDPLIPTSWAFLPALPLTPNGKIDRKALPAPDELRSPAPSASPSTPTEELLATLWAGVLGLDRVGIHQGFFELGGHSLLAIQVVSRVRDSFGIELPLQRLFENPTVAGLSGIIDSAKDLAVAGEVWSARPERPPLSFSQQSLWLVERLQPADGAYNLPTAVRLEGPLDAAALATALGGVVSRHESLRTRFAETDGEPWQEILPAPAEAPRLPLTDLSGLPEGRREEEALRAARAEAGRAFDLTAGPLLRALLVRLGPAEHLFLLVVHHAVSDGWSDQILLGDLAIFYQAAFEGRPAELPRLPLQYADYAIWQRQHLCGETLAKLLEVWRRRLAGVPPIDLPTDRRRPSVWTFRGASRGVDLEVSAADLEGLARSWNATSFMVVLTVFQALLGRYTGQNDFAVGTPSANRARYELEGLVGFFVNMLPLRADLSGAPVFGELLTRVRDTTLEAFANQDLPFELLVEDLAPERDLGRNPLFQVALQFGYTRATRFPGLAARRFDLGGGTAKFDLNLSMEQDDGRLVLFCEYPLDLFEDATIQRLLGHFQVLFAAGIAEPGRAVGDLPLLTEAEREQLLVGFNDTGSTSGPEVCLHQLFEAQAERTPERTALVAPEGTRLTYHELNERADRLAHRLRELGLGPERLAGVLMDRTADLVVTLLAVQKAGGAYAPLDPNYPRSRVLLMLETSRATVLVTRRPLAEAFAGELPAGLRTVFLDPGWETEPVKKPVEAQAALPDNLAYVIFTSGSTGVPKGVAIQHRSAVAMVRWAHTMYTAQEYGGVLASTSICFDMSVFEIFATLAAGGKIVLAENALALPDLEARDEVVLVDTVPSAMSELLRLGGLPSTVRTVNLGGEALKGSLVREIHAQLPGVERVVNLYGPSEDTTFTSYAVVPRDAEHPLIGRPLTGEAAYVLDAGMWPVPIGIPGALYMGGEGVTRGYLHRPDLTAERFIPNPYGPPGSRLYQVGDLVRYLPTGELDFLGRLDTQVKVRGFRIELGEIESALTRHPEVREAAVLASPEEAGGNRLIAYVESARDLAAGELRSLLKRSLPDYMVPAAFVLLRELPLTPNGKIDRRALAALPLYTEGAETTGSRAPRNYVEEVLAGIWSDVFGQAVGVTDNFFDLGGHSLLATRVVSRVREAFGIELPVRRLFERPTLAGLAESVEAALDVGGALEAPTIEPAPRTGPLPLSFSQRRLWFLDQLDPGSAVYNIPYPLRLEGRLDPQILQSAFAEVVRRHEALRTTFPGLDGEPYQAIAPAASFPLPVIDITGLPEALRSAEAAVLVESESRRPFDLGSGPLFRAMLLRLGPARHVLLLAMHHIVSDGWSLEILLRELAALYEACAAGRPSPLPELPVQYADFAVWQRRWLSGEALSRQLEHWRHQLAGAPAGLDLPTDFPRPAVQTFKGASHSAALPAELSAGIRAFCRREGVTLFMLLLAGFDVLLARYSGQEDVLVGSPVANRNRGETEGLIGFFVNTLVLRVQLGAASSFRNALRQAREAALTAYGHQDLPFETLVEELRPERDLSRTPFFQALLSLQTAGPGLPALGEVRLEEIEGQSTAAKFDLSLFVVDAETTLQVGVEYSTDLFEGATAVRLLGHIERLLAAAVSDPERGWRDLPLLTEAEREQLLVGFNDTGSTSGPELCLHQLFEAQVERTPERTALVDPEGVRLSYRELDARAGRLARRLRALGLGPERLAGVLMDRTADLVVTLLAVQKAGGAYAPLDPNYPRNRVLLMLETSRAAVLVTRRQLAEAFAGELPAGLRTVFLDPGWETEPVEELLEAQAALPDNLAYVIFTSGSTGVPKGVAIQHRSAVAMVRWAHAMYTPEEYAGVLASTSICFDMSVFEIFATLAAGGKILLAENALALPDLEARDEVVLVDTVPSAMSELLRMGRLPSTIRTVNLGGEALKGSLVREIYGQLPGVERVVNLYGPSEDTTFTSYAVVPRDAGHPLIGRPLMGEAAYVLDAAMRPVPVGIPGALYMGGEGVTRGYLHRPDLTAERFIPNPYGPPGSRLYQVGDLVRYLPTGELDFLGRLDTQVKVRGFRIELGEIESALTRHPEVREAAVLAMPEEAGGNRLVAYVESARDLAVGELRSLLKRSLPDYMVPSAFVLLRELPLTPNGKIDRRALVGIEASPAESTEAGTRAPRNYVEEVLAGIWSDVLGQVVEVTDNFFDLGGHSLLVTRVVSRIREAFGIELPVRRLFEQPTIAELAESVEAALGVGEALEVPPIEPAPRTSPLPLSFSQRRLWFLDQLDPGSAVYNIPYPLSLEGRLDLPVLQSAFAEVVRRHEALRTTFPSLDGEPYQAIAPAGPFPLPIVDLGGLPVGSREVEASALVERDALRPFDLGAGPLFRAALLRLEPERHLLLLAMHHIVSDGWSLEILLRELAALYAAVAAGRPSSLPELPVQYADFAVWQQRWLSGEALSRHLEHWRRQLAGAPAGLDLPTDFPRPAVQTFKGAGHSAMLPAELSAEIRAFCRREGVTLFMLLLAGFDVLLARYSGQEDVLVGSPVANRTRAEIEGLIGFFVNTLVLRVQLVAAASFRDALRQAREAALAAYGHQDLPFETLVEELRPERDLSRSPFVQELLSVQTASPGLPGLGEVRLEGIDGETTTAKFDLSLFVVDAEATLRTGVEYNTDLFESATAARLLGHIGRLLAAAVSDPERGWRDLPLLTEAEREQLLVGFNDTGSTSGPELCLHQLFEAQVERTPERTALVDPEGVRLSYRELNERAERLASRLRVLGLGPERLAGVLMDRTADLVMTLLAVHKAGGAYAPLDPNYPQSRVLLMLETSRAAVLVTRRGLAAAFKGDLPAGMRTVFLDPGWEMEPVESVVSQRALPDNLAYVIFTSGSTGVPKGVAIQHRSAVAMVRWAHAMYTPEEYAGVLASTSICFDMSVFEIFATLAAGGKILLAENALALPDLEARDEVVLVDTVPSAMSELLRLGCLPATIRTVNLGGEALKGSLVREIYGQLPGVERVVNLYGPSEDTTFTSYAVVPRDAGHPLIGRPLTGEAAYVLDAAMRPVPVGIPGALYMGGEGVTRGYLHRPDLTAERFIPNPYGPPGSRLYQVGDLVRYLPTGELDFLGRLDTQVKVRGFRIELGEIESALTRHPEVREAAVLAMPEEAGGNRLVAYVESARDLAAGELRSLLKQSLPEYMVPSAFVLLRELPLTPNGKIDRRALAAMPLHAEEAEAAGSRSPRNYVEEVLAGIWSDVFGQTVGVTDNFFDLGGHSLLATRVVSRIRAALHVELPLHQVFALPTVEGLAVWIGREMETRRGIPLPPIGRVSREESGNLPLSLAQQRLWFLDRLEPGTATFNLPAPLRLTGPLDPGALSRALDEIVRRHESLRTLFGEHEGHGVQKVRPAASVPLPWIDLSSLPAPVREPEALKQAGEEARLPFDLACGPLFRATLLRLGAGDWVLLATMHHIVSDGGSVEVFKRELRELYAAFAARRPSPLPELPLQVPDFAAWQRSALSEASEGLLEEWKRQFGTTLPDLRLPTDRPRPPIQTYRGSYRSLQLPAELSRELRRLAQRSGATLFMTLLAAFQALLHRYSGQERIVVGSPVAGRGRPELEGLIGFFVNTLVLPGDFATGLTFRQFLERTREKALGAYAFQDLPFDKLVEALQPVRDKSRSPLFQVMFLMHHEPADRAQDAAGSGGAIRMEPFDAGTGTSQFDLTLVAVDTPEGLYTGVEYNTDLFDAGTMDRLLEHYRSLLAAAAADPDVRLEELPVAPLTEAPQAVAETGAAPAAETQPEAAVDARRDRLASRLSKLSPAQREALERRLKGTPAGAEPPPPAGRCLVEIVPPIPAAPDDGRRPFFCIHPAGGDALCFFPLARHAGADQPFYGLQSRGLEDAGEPFATIEEMAAHYAGEIRRVQPRGPYRIGGWSFGGLAAFELARQLRAAGEEVELLAVIDTTPGLPGGPVDDGTAVGEGDQTGWLLTIAEYIRGLRGKDLAVTAADLRPLDPEAQLRFFVERLRRAGVVHSGDSLAQLRRLLRVYQTNVRAFRLYAPGPYDGRITLVRAEGADFDPALGPDLGWEKLSPHPIDRQHVPGDHLTLLAEPHVRTLAYWLRTRLGGSETS